MIIILHKRCLWQISSLYCSSPLIATAISVKPIFERCWILDLLVLQKRAKQKIFIFHLPSIFSLKPVSSTQKILLRSVFKLFKLGGWKRFRLHNTMRSPLVLLLLFVCCVQLVITFMHLVVFMSVCICFHTSTYFYQFKDWMLGSQFPMFESWFVLLYPCNFYLCFHVLCIYTPKTYMPNLRINVWPLEHVFFFFRHLESNSCKM